MSSGNLSNVQRLVNFRFVNEPITASYELLCQIRVSLLTLYDTRKNQKLACKQLTHITDEVANEIFKEP